MDLQNWIIEKVGVDKVLHFTSGGWFSSFFEGTFWILLAGLLIGLFKDLVIDKLIRKTECDWGDVAWTFAGSVATSIVKIVLEVI